MIARLLPPFVVALLVAGYGQAQESGSAVRGLEYAAENCAECHAIDFENYDSPLDQAPSFMEIANSRGMSEIALFPFFQTSHDTMPNFIVAPDDIADLTAYILGLRAAD